MESLHLHGGKDRRNAGGRPQRFRDPSCPEDILVARVDIRGDAGVGNLQLLDHPVSEHLAHELVYLSPFEEALAFE